MSYSTARGKVPAGERCSNHKPSFMNFICFLYKEKRKHCEWPTQKIFNLEEIYSRKIANVNQMEVKKGNCYSLLSELCSFSRARAKFKCAGACLHVSMIIPMHSIANTLVVHLGVMVDLSWGFSFRFKPLSSSSSSWSSLFSKKGPKFLSHLIDAITDNK